MLFLFLTPYLSGKQKDTTHCFFIGNTTHCASTKFMFMKITTKYLISVFLFLTTIGIIFLFKNNPQLTENVYSTGIYPYISKMLRYIFGWIPFSMGDIFYTGIGIYILYFLTINIKNFKYFFKEVFAKISFFIAVIFFLFHFLWGFNYYRVPLSETLQLGTTYTEEQLLEVTHKLIDRANFLHQKLTQTDTSSVKIPLKIDEIYQLAPSGYEVLSKNFPAFKLHANSLKSSIYSKTLSYMGYSGYLNPFTNEAQVNRLAMEYQTPVTATHEMAHQLGYAAENEANFIGYLAAWHNENVYFKYGACLFALRYCLSEIKKSNPTVYQEVTHKIRAGILKNYENNYQFWQKYQNPFEPIFKASYDTFLKANNQKQGIQSYNYVTGMIINYELKN